MLPLLFIALQASVLGKIWRNSTTHKSIKATFNGTMHKPGNAHYKNQRWFANNVVLGNNIRIEDCNRTACFNGTHYRNYRNG